MRIAATIVIAGLLAPMPVAEPARSMDRSQSGFLPCTLYEHGVGRMERGDYVEALKDLDQVTSSCPSSDLKGEAWLRKGEIYLVQFPVDIAKARQVVQVINQQYGQTPAAAGAIILDGRIGLAESRTKAGLDAASAAFDRASAAARSSPRFAEAAYYAGEALRLSHRPEDALAQYREAELRYPGTIWAARALLGTARCYARTGQHALALEALQRVQTEFANTAEAGTALDWGTILYRLRLRPSGEAPFQYANKTIGSAESKFKDGVGVLIDRQGRVVVAHRGGWSVFDAAGQPVGARRGDAASAVALAPDGTIVVADDGSIAIDRDGAATLRPMIPQSSGQPKAVKVTALVATWRGSWLVADSESKEVRQFSPDFSSSQAFINLDASRLAVSDIDDVAALDKDKRLVVLLDRDANNVAGIGRQGPGYQLDEPVDMAFDALANLYVLDGRQRAVHVFDSAMKFIRTFQIPAKGAAGGIGKPSALGVDAAGRLYIFGNDLQRVLVYQ